MSFENLQRMEKLSLLVDCKNMLGESPTWSCAENALYWVDYIRGELWRYDFENGAAESVTLDSPASSIAPCDDGRLLIACKDGMAFYDWQSREREVVAQLENENSPNIPNEGRCDPAGRFWVGTMPENGLGNSGSLYRICSDLKPQRVLGDLSVPNTLVWAPDFETMYFADSTEQTIYAFDYDIESGEIDNRRVFAMTKGQECVPDGSAIDEKGQIWNAEWGGGCITCYADTGEIVDVIRMPVMRPTSCAFGGIDGTTLFITTARNGLSDKDLEQQPSAGGLFAIPMSIAGAVDALFKTHA